MVDCAHGSAVITKGTAELGMAVQADAGTAWPPTATEGEAWLLSVCFGWG